MTTDAGGEPGFYRKLHDLIVSDPDIRRYRSQMDGLREKKKLIMARAEAACAVVDKEIAIVSARHERKHTQLTTRFLRLRRKELGVKPTIKDDRP